MFSTFAKALLAGVVAAGSGSFSYSKGGKDWGDLTDVEAGGNNVCGSGKKQSPIDLDWEAKVDDNLKIELGTGANSYQDTTMSFPKLWNTVQVTATSGGFKKTFETDSSNSFKPAQFHFHAPSEHTINGKHMDLEMHIVHQAADGEYAVLGFMFDQDEAGDGENLFIDQIMPVTYDSISNTATKKVNLKGFLDSVWMGQFWSYDGSLTTPPCSEGIRWSVLSEIQPISAAQMKEFNDIWQDNEAFAYGNGNNRKVQPLNDRELTISWKQETHEDETLRAAMIVFAVLFSLVTVGLIVVLVLAFVKPAVFGLEKSVKSVPKEGEAPPSERKLADNTQ